MLLKVAGRRAMLFCGSCAAGLLISLPALAQSAAASAASGPDLAAGAQIDEIVVTARRTAEPLQTVPVAITAFAGEALSKSQITTGQDLQGRVPSLSVAPGGQTRNAESFTIRGQGATFGAGPGVVTYFAEVPLPQNNYTGAQGGGAAMFYDLANLQVLKGPQGTLFGRNTTGGAVLVEPQRPVEAFGGYLMGQVGNLADREVEGAINLPLIPEKLLVRVAGSLQDRHGYTTNVTNGQKLDDRGRNSLRLGVIWRPTDAVENYFTGYHLYSRDHGTSTVLNAVNPAVLNGVFAPIGGCAGLGVPDCFQSLVDAQNARGPRHVALSTQPYDRTEAWGVSDILSIRLNDQLTLRNIVSHSRLQNSYGIDFDGSPVAIDDIATPRNINSTDVEQTTEELQLQGKAQDGRLTYVTGVYTEWSRPRGPQSQTGIVFFTPNVSHSYSIRRSKAVYGQFTYDLGGLTETLSGLRLTGGLRYTKDKLIGFSDYIFDKSINQSTSEPTWTAGLDYKVRNSLLYGKVSRGYKQGGFSALAVDVNHATFEPEFVTTYELGEKTDFHVFGRAARLNAAVYYSDYSDIQRTGGDAGVIGGQTVGGAATFNAGKATIKGVELEGVVLPFSGFELSANYAYMDAKYDKYDLAISAPQLDCQGLVSPFALPGARVSSTANLSCIPFQFAPKHQFSVNARYTLPLSDDVGVVSLAANYAYTDKVYTSPTGTPQGEPYAWLPSYGLLNLNVDWRNVYGSPVDITLFMKNVTDKTYKISNYAVYSQLGISQYIYGEPRTYGVQVRYRFGG